MKCENCPLLTYPNVGEATPDYDPYCGFEDVYTPTKDDEGCHIPWNKVEKILRDEAEARRARRGDV